MGKNDHDSVPDPTPRGVAPLPSKVDPHAYAYPEVAPPTKVPEDPIGGPTTSSKRLDALEANMSRLQDDFAGVGPGPTITSSRLHTLEQNWKNQVAEAVSVKTSMVNLSNSIIEIVCSMANLHRNLKQTARGVERLAQGHSSGNLGLPTEDDWSRDTTL